LERRSARRAASEQPESEVLIKEVRRRTRRRRLLTAGVVVLLALLAGGIYALSSRSSIPPLGSSSPASGVRTGVASTGKVTPDQPVDLAVSHDGDLYIADRGRNEILEWTPSGRFQVVAGTGVAGLSGDGGPADSAEVNYPSSLVIAPDGAVYFAQTGRSYPPVNSSSSETFSTAIREVTPAGTIRTIAGLHPHCSSGPVESVPANSALIEGASLSLSSSGGLVLNATLCVDVGRGQSLGPNMELTSSESFVRHALTPVPAVASIGCGAGVPGSGFLVFGCGSGGGGTAYAHGPELLVVRSNGSHVGYPSYGGLDFATGDSEVVATYEGNLVRVTSSRLVPLLSSRELQSDLQLRPHSIADLGTPAVGAGGDIYFVASIIAGGCQNRILERTTRGAVRQLWSSSDSRHNTCF
jgi:hypothetical protein